MSNKNPSVRSFGVQSYCFRNFKDNQDVAGKVRQIGVDSLELCAVHANFDDLNAFKEVVKVYKDAGIAIPSIGVQTFTGKAAERNWFECARAAGAKYISAHFQIDTFTTAVPATVKLCNEYGIRIAIHNHGGYMFGGSPDVLSHLLALGGEQIGLCIDTAWALQTGPWLGDPVKWVEQFGKRIYGIHFKDFVFDRAGMWTDVVVGEGNLKLADFTAALDKSGFDGYAVIEYEADPENPVPALKRCVDSMRATLG